MSDNQPTAMQLRERLVEQRARYYQGGITIDQLHACADEYIAALKAYRKASGKRFSVPCRAYLIRAL